MCSSFCRPQYTHTQHTDAKPSHACTTHPRTTHARTIHTTTTHVRAHAHKHISHTLAIHFFDKLIVACRQLGGRVPPADGIQRCGPQTHTRYQYTVHATATPAVGYLERLLLGEVPAYVEPLLTACVLYMCDRKHVTVGVLRSPPCTIIIVHIYWGPDPILCETGSGHARLPIHVHNIIHI